MTKSDFVDPDRVRGLSALVESDIRRWDRYFDTLARIQFPLLPKVTP